MTVGNPDAVVLALLVATAPYPHAAAAAMKVYAVVPLLLLRRWRSLTAVVVVMLVTAPFLPWPAFLASQAVVEETLAAQSNGGKSALAVPVLVPLVIVALLVLGRARAAWLAVPALWPATQFHYSVLALPAASPFMAAVFALPVPGAPAVAVIAGAIEHVIRHRIRQRQPRASDAGAYSTSSGSGTFGSRS